MNEPKAGTPDIKIIDIDRLRPHPLNPKVHSQDQIEKISRSIEVNGWGRSILVTPNDDGETYTIIAGHATTKAAEYLGMEQVPAVVATITPEQAIALMVADNRLAELADTDAEALGLIFSHLSQEYPDMDLEASTGYDHKEIIQFMPDGGDTWEDESYDAPAEYQAIEEPVTQRGDLWLLGNHRLLCGDSTNPRDVATLMNGKEAKLCFTDPPYNVNYDQKNGSPRKQAPKSGLKNNTIMNDNMSRADFKRFLDKVIASIFAVNRGPVYICMSCKEWATVMGAFEEAGGHWSSTIIWNKSNFVLSRKDYHPKFEPIVYGWAEQEELNPDFQPILYGWKEGHEVRHLITRSESDVWDVAKPGRNVDHPTMKPIELVGRAIKNSSELNDIVVDFFHGSGSTTMAADQLGRICYGMELDPKYVDVAVKRWEEATGKEAVRIPNPNNNLADPEPLQPGPGNKDQGPGNENGNEGQWSGIETDNEGTWTVSQT